MKVYQTNEIKNIALLGNDGAGKTTLTEALLYEAGIISRRGRITAKNTVSDYFPVEQEYGYSVFSTVFHVEWNGKKLNIIDCPGADDFVGAAMTALHVTDTALLLINGQYGPEVGTQNHFRYTEKLGKPVIFLVNQLDSDKCDYHQGLDNLTSIYGPKETPMQPRCSRAIARWRRKSAKSVFRRLFRCRSVSRLMFTASSPASVSSGSNLCKSTPLVVRANCRMPAVS